MRPSRRLSLSLAATALIAIGCSIPTEQSARPVDDVPEGGLLSTTTATVVPVEPDFFITLYFYNDQEQLVSVKRATEQSPLLQDVLGFLTTNPLPEEQAEFPSISTRLLPDIVLTTSAVNEEQRSVTISVEEAQYREFAASEPQRIQRVFSQIVCTMTEAKSDIDSVRLVDSDGDIPVQGTLDGSVIEGPVNRADMNDCKTAQQLAAEVLEQSEAEGTETTEGG